MLAVTEQRNHAGGIKGFRSLWDVVECLYEPVFTNLNG